MFSFNEILKVPGVLITLDIIFGILHYYFHKNKFLYNNFHYLHHKLIITDAVSSIYAHPIDYIITNVMPSFITLYIWKVSYNMCVIYLCVFTVSVVNSHTNYKNEEQSSHGKHHIYQIYNYDNFPYLFDKLIKTYY